MKVVIVAKTRMGSGACIGGLTFDGRSVRLVPPDREWNDQFNQEYNVGDVWEIDYRPAPDILPPHVENIDVRWKRPAPPIDDLPAFIEVNMPPKAGGLDALFEGLTQATQAGVLYVAARTGVPPYSTLFWRPDRPLVRDDDAKRIRYRYPTEDGGRTLTFVGFQEPVPEIPAGAIVRVSLAHWWRPAEMLQGELRCYVQLSGWFLPPVSAPPPAAVRPLPAADAASAVRRSPLATLKAVFGYDEFRPLQEEIIASLLDGRDALAIMPTGSGKSLCYQLPALLFPGLTVVVSPLISLMEDQVTALRELGVPAVFLNSTLSYAEYEWTVQQIRAGRVRLLYAAPETLLRPETLLLLEQARVDCFTIDEAHCISEWGHDFRPEFRQLAEVRRRLPRAVCLAVTATATERVRDDIKTSLHIPDAQAFLASFNRENLFLAVEPKTDTLAQTLAFLGQHRHEAGIIYCATRRQVDELTAHLQAHGYQALPYHAGLDDRTRRDHQRRFSRDDAPIIVATIAFGMGIDKSNVRFILHVDLPKNLESYYQQIGRAGRDGLRADCLLLYSYGDVNTINHFISEQEPSQQLGAKMRLEALLRFTETNVCRRRPLLTYFDEPYDAGNCGMCDNCTTSVEDLVDITIPAQKFLSCVKRTGEIFGVNHVIDVLRGSQSQKVLARGHDRLSTYDIGREYSQKEWQYLARQFIQQGLLVQDMEHGSLKLTPKAYAVFRGETVLGTMLEAPRPEKAVVAPHDVALFDLLRAKRKALADAANLPPYTIFSDRTLVEMAIYYPQSTQRLATLYGVGAAKLQKYADEFLPIIRAYCAEQGVQEKRKPVTSGSGAKRRREEVVELWNDGHNLADLAAQYQIKVSTVLNHLWGAMQEGAALRAGDLLAYSELPPAEQERVLDAFAAHGADFLRPVFDALDGRVSFDELHLFRLHYVLARQGEQ